MVIGPFSLQRNANKRHVQQKNEVFMHVLSIFTYLH